MVLNNRYHNLQIYILSILISIILNIIGGNKIKNSLPLNDEIEYDENGKYETKKFNIKNLGSLALLFIPIINILISVFTTAIAFSGYLKNNNINKFINQKDDIENIIEVYKGQEKQKDMLLLEGLSEKEALKEIERGNSSQGLKYISEEMYRDILAAKEAKDFFNQTLLLEGFTRKEQIELLKEYRKAFLSEKEALKPIEKTMKIINKK